MAVNKLNPVEGGIPKGTTANRSVEFPSPQIGDVYYNGEIEALEIYNGTTWKVSKTEGFPPDAPTISSVTDSSTSIAYSSTAGTLNVVFVPAGTGGTPTQYNAYTTVGGHSGFTTVGNTVTITGLTPGTAYTVYGNAQNSSGISTNTANASPVTPTTLPQAPTIGTTTLSAGLPVVNWTLNNNGGKNLTSITITPYLNGVTAQTSHTAATTSSTSYSFTSGQLVENSSYTFKVKTTNANGDGVESSASNSVTVDEFFSVDYLVVAGGGSATFGGGGAGGLRSTVTGTGGSGSLETPLSLTSGTNYTVTVGAGGAATTYSSAGNNGANSVFSTITSTGGGGGGSGNTGNGLSGGSGAGGGHGFGANPQTKPTGGAASPSGQGFAGGGGGGEYFGGGGGGASEAGYAGYQNNDNNTGDQTGTDGDGGAGRAVSITGSSVTYAGGGGGAYGGTGGAGGGGNAGSNATQTNGSNGTANLGGGGGASNATRGAGGSGVVILRWLTAEGSITVGAGLTADATGTDGSYSYKRFTAGSGNVSWS